MIRKEGYIAGCVSICALALFFTFPTTHAQAATIYFSPSTFTRATGQTFAVTVRVNTDAQSINAAQGSVVFDPAKIEVVSVSKAGSIFNLWTQDPVFSNADGTLDFEGGLPNPGYSGSSGLIATITFRTKTATTVRGSTTATLVSGAILANDGLGTNILTNLGKLTVVISPGTYTNNTQPEVVPQASESAGPKVSSSTHPDSTKWYSNNNPSFTWNLPSDATGVSYLITDKSAANPGPNSDGLVSKASFTGIPDGTQYLHLKFKENGAWGLIAHYQFNIDTVAPVGFGIRDVSADGIKPQISFETTDALSGIDHYDVRIGDNGSWITVSSDQAGKPYQLSFNRIGNQTVYVKAVDKASNSTTESTQVSISGSAVSSSVALWIGTLLNGLVNFVSNYSLWLLLFLALIGLAILIVRGLGATIDKYWHKANTRRVIRKAEHKADSTLDRLMGDMADEIKFLNTIAKRRRLGNEEKYLKNKIEQYLKTLKSNNR
jgi:hypothetical protein